MAGGSKDKGKEKVGEPRGSKVTQGAIRAFFQRPRGRDRGIVIQEPIDTQMTHAHELLPRHLLDTDYISPLSGSDLPPELLAELAQDLDDDETQLGDHDTGLRVDTVPTGGSGTVGAGTIGAGTVGGSCDDSRFMISPRGNEFSHKKLCARAIGKIMESKFEGPWPSYRVVPLPTRDLWFRQFELSFRWRDEDAWEIRRIFDIVGGHCMKHRMYDVKRANRRPVWIPQTVWADLLLIWGSEPYKKKAQTNKKNWVSNTGGRGYPLHFGGSISHLAHRDRLRERLGRDPTLVEGFCTTHVKVMPDGTEHWSDNASHSLHDSYVDRYQPPSSEGSTSTPSVQIDVEIERWTDLAGGEKKGSVVGLAGLAARRHELHVPLTQMQTPTPTQREEHLQREVEELRSQHEEMQTRLQTQNEELQAQLRQQSMDLQATQRDVDSLKQIFLHMQHGQPSSSLPRPVFTYPSWPPPPHGTGSQSGQPNMPPNLDNHGDDAT